MRLGSWLVPSVMALALALGGCETTQADNYLNANKAAEAGRYDEAFRLFSAVAAADNEIGQAAAQYRVGEMYLEGQGTSRDPLAAKRMFELSAKTEERSWRRLALYKLGDMYEDGIPGAVEIDRQEASKYFKMSADSGYALAGERFETLQRYPDIFVPQHADEFSRHPGEPAPAGLEAGSKAFQNGALDSAFKIFAWYARAGDVQAQIVMAKFYKDGLSVQKDPVRYAAWSWIAAKNGHPAAQMEIGLLFRDGRIIPYNQTEAIYWLSQASSQGLADATNELGVMAANPVGKNVQPDWKKAVMYFKRAAENGSISGLVNLADALSAGLGVRKDVNGARILYQTAADAGNVIAHQRLLAMGVTPEALAKSAEAWSKASVSGTRVQVPLPETGYYRAPEAGAPKLSPVEIYVKLSPSVFRLIAANTGKGDAATGSGVALTSSLAITNCHVTEGHNVLGGKIDGQVTVFNPNAGNRKKDICIIKADQRLVPVAEYRRYSDLKVGEKVYAIGSPKSLENTLSEGIISGLRVSDGIRYIQTTAPIAPGSSGGGLFDESGRLIGITTWKIAGEGNLNFAVAVDEALEVLDRSR